MRRVLVIGSGGAGKSVLAKKLGQNLSLAVVHLDKLYWKPGWVEPSKEEWLATVERLLAQEAWVMDGNYSATLERRLEACDTVIFLDIPRLTCIWRVLKRSITHFNRTRPDMAAGCAERLSIQFLTWVWNYPRRSRPKILKLLLQHQDRRTVISLRSNYQIERFLKQVTHEAHATERT